MNSSHKFKQYFFTYLSVFIVPIVAMAVFFLYENIINSRNITEDYNFGLLTQYNNEIDLYISELQNYALALSNDSKLSGEAGLDTNKEAEILSLLNTYKDNLSENITPAYYPRGSQNIIIDDTISTYSDFEKSNYYQFSLSLSGLFVKLNNVNSQYILSLDKNNDIYSPYSYSTAILYPIPLIAAHPQATLCFLIRGQFFIDIQNKYFTHLPTQIFVLDGKHQILYNNETQDLTQAELSALIKNNKIGISVITLAGNKFVLMRNVSPTTGCNYLSITPYSDFYAHGQENINLLFLLAFLLIIFSILMAATLAKRYIFSIANVESKNNEITIELNSRNTIIREMVLRKILYGTITDGDTDMMNYNLQCANIEFSYPFFTVAVCQITNLSADDELYDKAIYHLENTIFSNGICYPIKLAEENQIAVIVNSTTEEHLQALLTDMVYTTCSPLFPEELTIGCGGTQQSCYKVDTSFIEANVAIRKRTNKAKADCYIFDNSFDTINQEFAYPHLESAILEQSVRSGNPQAALESLRNIFERIEQMPPSIIIQQCLHYDVINMVAKIGQALHIPLTSRDITNLTTYNSFESLHQKVETVIISMTEKSIDLKNQQHINTKHSLIEFVRDHYKENSMSLDLLASHFNLSYSYISKIFKDETSQTFSAYITELRIHYVKQQLVLTSLPIKDIISNAGYIDTANFMRKFKQLEGITPGQYRQIYGTAVKPV